jgi:hypothetical protein
MWAHYPPNAKSLVETRLSGRLHINSQILVAGVGFHDIGDLSTVDIELLA